jgi:hypothetical protein
MVQGKCGEILDRAAETWVEKSRGCDVNDVAWAVSRTANGRVDGSWEYPHTANKMVEKRNQYEAHGITEHTVQSYFFQHKIPKFIGPVTFY